MEGGVDEPVVVLAYDPSWPGRFAAEARRLRERLPAAAVALEHVGSTAVAGLDAKPVVDIQVGVRGEPDGLVEPLRALGYEALGEAGVPGRLYFRRRTPGAAFNVHVVAHEGPLWRDNLRLRDHLRAHPADARRSAAAKRCAAAAAPDSLLRYSALKASVVAEVLERARA
jgi:GrpB-like predicted nucleotidyltransferase (UPF0157 family)